MDQKSSEQLQCDMNATRAALSEKVAALEDHVLETLHDAASAVQDSVLTVHCAVKEAVGGVSAQVDRTVAGVQNSVSDISQSVRSMMNVSEHIRQNPWTSVLCAASSGFAVGIVLHNRPQRHETIGPPNVQPRMALNSMPANSARSGLWDDILQMVSREARAFAESAIASLAQSLKAQVETRISDQFTAKAASDEVGQESGCAKHEHNGVEVPY